jgi:hypothetical protein
MKKAQQFLSRQTKKVCLITFDRVRTLFLYGMELKSDATGHKLTAMKKWACALLFSTTLLAGQNGQGQNGQGQNGQGQNDKVSLPEPSAIPEIILCVGGNRLPGLPSAQGGLSHPSFWPADRFCALTTAGGSFQCVFERLALNPPCFAEAGRARSGMEAGRSG